MRQRYNDGLPHDCVISNALPSPALSHLHKYYIAIHYKIGVKWMSHVVNTFLAPLWYLNFANHGDTTVLHLAIDIILLFHCHAVRVKLVPMLMPLGNTLWIVNIV